MDVLYASLRIHICLYCAASCIYFCLRIILVFLAWLLIVFLAWVNCRQASGLAIDNMGKSVSPPLWTILDQGYEVSDIVHGWATSTKAGQGIWINVDSSRYHSKWVRIIITITLPTQLGSAVRQCGGRSSGDFLGFRMGVKRLDFYCLGMASLCQNLL